MTQYIERVAAGDLQMHGDPSKGAHALKKEFLYAAKLPVLHFVEPDRQPLMTETGAGIYEFANYRLDIPERLLLRDGLRVQISSTPFEVLCFLVRRPGVLVSKDELLGNVWEGAAVEENNLDKSISRLRQILGETGGSRQFIETVRGHGFRFIEGVVALPPGTVSAFIHSSDPSESIEPDSIAVLAFKNLSPDPDNDYFCEGLADELINGLSKSGHLRVAARSSAFSFKGKDAEFSEIGAALGVRTILEGSVRTSGDRLRIIVRLVNAADGYTIWSEKYDRQLKDIFDIQDEITLAVVDALNVKLYGPERDAILKHYTSNTDAYLLNLKGQYYRWRSTPEDFAHALKYFEMAVAADPSFALGHFGISTYYGYGSAWGMLPVHPDQGWPLAESAARRALELDSSLPELRLSFAAFDLVHYRKWDQAGAELGAIAAAYPRFAEIHHLYSFYLLIVGRFDEAIKMGSRALALDPLSVLFSRFVGIYLYFAGRYDEAVNQLKDALELEPNNPVTHDFLGDVYLKQGLHDRGLAEKLSSARLSNDTELAAILEKPAESLDETFAAVGRLMLDRARARMQSGAFFPSSHCARFSLMTGDIDATFGWLSKAVDEHNVFPLLMNTDPFFEPLRPDPRFRSILRRIGYPGAE